MACGCACILSNSGGLVEYARHGENCLIVPVGDVQAAADGVCRLLDDPALRRSFVDEGLKTVAPYAEENATRDFLNVIYETHPRFR
jgi:glycosyltransferase involved in cell wall biosynthesis